MKVAFVLENLEKEDINFNILKVLISNFKYWKIYCLKYDPNFAKKHFDTKKIISKFENNHFLAKFIDYFDFIKKTLIEDIDIEESDLVISIGGENIHSIITKSKSKHIGYLTQFNEKLWTPSSKSLFKKNRSRIWDFYSMKRPEILISSTKNIKKQVKKYLKRDSVLIYPAASDTIEAAEKQNYFLTTVNFDNEEELLNLNKIIDLFNKIGRKLIIIGDGKQRINIEKKAADNIEFLGNKDQETILAYLRYSYTYISITKKLDIYVIYAMIARKSPIVFQDSENSELINASKNGEIFEKNEQKVLEDTISKSFLNADNYSNEYIQSFASKFYKTNFLKEFEKIIEKVF